MHQEKGKRKMRVDEDFKVALCEKSIETKKAKSGRQMARCTGGVNENAAAAWEVLRLGAQIRASQRRIVNISGTWGLCADGIRIGDPAEETWCSVLTNPRADVGMVVTPMVPLFLRLCLAPST